MEDGKGLLEKRIKELEALMSRPDFWGDKERAQTTIKEHKELKERLLGGGTYDKGNALITIFSGAGGDDAEDFSGMLFRMYNKYAGNQGWGISMLHKHENGHGGYRNVTFEIEGKGAYGTLKNESGVHRLVRISPFSARKLRHTSFSLVEVVPELPKEEKMIIPDADLRVEFSKAGGPGGQNVNKRETAVRVTHIPTNITAHVNSERTQERNRDKAIQILQGKLYRLEEERKKQEEAGFKISKTTEAEWGSQIRSYVLHPYKMVKDHRTNVEVRDTEAVLERGMIDEFIKAERGL